MQPSVFTLIMLVPLFATVSGGGPSLPRPTPEPESLKFLSPRQDEVVLIGSTVTLHCQIENLLDGYPVVWMNGTMMLSLNEEVYTGPARVAMDRSTSTFDLILPDVDLTTEGNYTCQVPGSPPVGGQLKHSLTVNIPAAVILDTEDYEIEMEKGESRTIRCYGDGKPSPKITWRHLSNTVGTPNKLFDSDTLHLTEVKPEDAGSYECMAVNGAGAPASAATTVNVRYAPTVTVEDDIIYTGPGRSNILICKFTGSPEVNVTWTQNGSALVLDGRSNLQLGKNREKSLIRIENLQAQDLGKYQCLGTNNRGTASAMIELSANPYDLEIKSPQQGDYSDQYILEWEVSSIPRLIELDVHFYQVNGSVAELVWKKSVHPLIMGNMVEHKQSYTIKGLQSNSTYTIKVRARNEFGRTNWTDEFTFRTHNVVRTAPPPTTRPPPTTPLPNMPGHKEPTEPKAGALQPGPSSNTSPSFTAHLITTWMAAIVTALLITSLA